MRSLPADLFDARFYALVGAVFVLHAVGLAGESTAPRAALWFGTGLGWFLVAALLRHGRSTQRPR
ncbi:hypothetical protein [Halorientalis marina]|jgi:hypothetical protein|uniref:hypothetical protein n=1 Tax=Halorientalis marina TaxID=2931976 RepID=UPI001FF3659A|nr:hypothetical protein [Halorientalis marina]